MKKRSIILVVALFIASALAVVVFWPQDDLKHLKKTEELPQETAAAMEIVNSFIAAVAKKDLKTAASYIYVRDRTEMDRIMEVLQQKPHIGSLKPLGCSRLVKSSHKDNLMVHVYSETQKMSYAFVLMKNSNGKYQIAELGSSSRKP